MKIELSLQSFRAFRERQSFELRPLTLLYGHNQSGKSTLLRLLPLLADSLEDHGAALDLASSALRGASLRELGWLGRAPMTTPTIGIRADTTPDAPRMEWSFDLEQGKGIARSLRIGRQDWHTVLRFDERVGGELSSFVGRYSGTCGDEEWQGELTFRSLVPSGLPEATVRDLSAVREALGDLRRGQWLQANRLVAEGDRAASFCRPDGSDLAQILERLPQWRRVLDAASAQLVDMGFGEELTLGWDGDGRPRLESTQRERKQLPAHLAGEGFRAAVPMAVLLAWGLDAASGERPRWLAIEEPESHLHPDIQVRVANRFVAAAKAGLPVVLETHSPYILRAVQLAILDQRILPSDVALHWVDQRPPEPARIKRISIDDAATLAGWPPDTFAEERDLALRIMEARLRRSEP